MATLVHKANSRSSDPLVSLVLLDWECRERFHSLDWLNRQDAPRDQYEIIWVELFNRVVPAAMELADVVITCRQKGLYHKHHGYNIGLLQARGAITVICDSDAIYPPGFISSILAAFKVPGGTELKAMVLMYYQWRSNHTYPDGFSDVSQLQQYEWRPLLPNAGACVCMRTVDSLRFGGFDEHRSLRGYLCGPYELGWRLVNAGLPEIWHDEAMASWHFQHPEPLGLALSGFSRRRWREVAYPHVDHHALTAVEAFSSGSLLPLKENAEVHARRMALRRIGTKFEEKYATMTGPQGFTRWQWLRMHLKLLREGQTRTLRALCERLGLLPLLRSARQVARVPVRIARRMWRSARGLARLLRGMWRSGLGLAPLWRGMWRSGLGLAPLLRRMWRSGLGLAPLLRGMRRSGLGLAPLWRQTRRSALGLAHSMMPAVPRFLQILRNVLGERKYQRLRAHWHALRGR